jgi:hypothetical protein
LKARLKCLNTARALPQRWPVPKKAADYIAQHFVKITSDRPGIFHGSENAKNHSEVIAYFVLNRVGYVGSIDGADGIYVIWESKKKGDGNADARRGRSGQS